MVDLPIQKKKYPHKKLKIGYVRALKIASWQLAFKLESIKAKGIRFDETLGSGVSNAGGEEHKFLYDCIRSGLRIIYIPVNIGRMTPSSSQWWKGFTNKYFFDRGIMTRKLMGKWLSTLYAIYFLTRKYPLYKKDISIREGSKHLLKGIFNK